MLGFCCIKILILKCDFSGLMEPPTLAKSATDRKRQKIRRRNRKILGNLGIENENSVCLRRKKRKGSPEYHVNIDLVRTVRFTLSFVDST